MVGVLTVDYDIIIDIGKILKKRVRSPNCQTLQHLVFVFLYMYFSFNLISLIIFYCQIIIKQVGWTTSSHNIR